MLQLALSDTPVGPFYLDLTPYASDVNFSTNQHGFDVLTCFLRRSLWDGFMLYDRSILPHITLSAYGLIAWEGRAEDIAIVNGGLRLTAFGYSRGYSDLAYTAEHLAASPQAIAQALVAFVSGANPFMSSSTALIENPGTTLNERYRDKTPADILDRLLQLGDTQTPPRQWEAGVYEERRLHFRPRGSAGRAWYVDASRLDVERTLETLVNSAYGIYQSNDGQRVVTATVTNADSIARFGLTRRRGIHIQSQSQTIAERLRDAYLANYANPPTRAEIDFAELYDGAGGRWPLWAARSGDSITIRNLTLTLGADVDQLRSFRIKETHYSADADQLSVVPEANRPTLDAVVSNRAIIGTGSSGGRIETIPDANEGAGPTYEDGNLIVGGQLRLPTAGSSGGVLIGEDAHFYRGAADRLTTPDDLQVQSLLRLGTSLTTNQTGERFTLADDATKDLPIGTKPYSIIFIRDNTGGNLAIVATLGGRNLSAIIYDQDNVWRNADTDTFHNIFRLNDGGGDRYVIKNRRGGNRTYDAQYFSLG